MKDFKKTIIELGAAAFASIAVICIGVTATVLARPLYYLDMHLLKITETSGISAAACKLNYDTLIEYNLLGGPDELIFPTLQMSETGRIHFEEVKDIFITMQIVAITAVILLVVWCILYYHRKVSGFRWMRLTGWVTLVVATLVGVFVAIDWEAAFVMMHKIFFRNDYWLFNAYTDPVIKILPSEFFMHCGILIIALVLIQIGILELGYRRLKNGRSDF